VPTINELVEDQALTAGFREQLSGSIIKKAADRSGFFMLS